MSNFVTSLTTNDPAKLTSNDSNDERIDLPRTISISDEHTLGVLPDGSNLLNAELKSGDEFQNLRPQSAPGACVAIGHNVENSIPLSIFPIQADKYCICFCGLPGRGKTHISRRLARYLSFFHAIPTKVFNAADYRRRILAKPINADFFDPTNIESFQVRIRCNQAALNDMKQFLQTHANAVVILDATNPTYQRRQEVVDQMNRARAKVLFIEVTNESSDFLSKQYQKIIESSPDYTGISHSEAEKDFLRRVELYRTYFEPLDGTHAVESRWSFFKCAHSRKEFTLHNVHGYIPLKVVNFIMIMRTGIHSFYMTRHGQSEYNQLGRIGGDSGLSEHGLAYAHKLAEYVEEKVWNDIKVLICIPYVETCL